MNHKQDILYRSVKEVIMQLFSNNPHNWFSSRYISAHLKESMDRTIKPTSYLLRLIMKGHVIRAIKPKEFVTCQRGRREYI